MLVDIKKDLLGMLLDVKLSKNIEI